MRSASSVARSVFGVRIAMRVAVDCRQRVRIRNRKCLQIMRLVDLERLRERLRRRCEIRGASLRVTRQCESTRFQFRPLTRRQLRQRLRFVQGSVSDLGFTLLDRVGCDRLRGQ